MANLKDFATAQVANTPGTSGTTIDVSTGLGARFPATPFSATVHPLTELPTLDNSERVLVTALTGDSLTVTRATGDATAKDIQSGWRISNSVFLSDFEDKADASDLTAIKTKTDDITVTGGITGQVLVQQPGGGFAPQTIDTGDNNVTNNYNTQNIDSNLTVGNYGALTGLVNSSNTSYTVSTNVYASGSLEVFINGKQSFDFAEVTPNSGTFTISDTPQTGDWLVIKYLTTATSADTLFDPSKVYFQTMQQLVDAYALYGGSVVYAPIGMIDAGSVSLELTSENLIITGNDYFVSGIYSTANNYTMFKNAAGQFASNIDIMDCSFWTSGTSSKIFDLDGTGNSGAIEFSSCNIGDFAGSTTEIGTLTGFRQFKTSNCGFFRTQGSLKFAGTWSGGFRITETIVLAQGAGTKLFEPVAGLTFAGRCISDINAASVNPTTITFDFVPGNFLLDGGFQLGDASFAPNSSISVTTDETSVKAYFTDCVEIRNTRPGFEAVWTTDTNTPLTVNTPTKALGTTVIDNATWFEQTANNEWSYLSSLTKDLSVDLDINVDGGANDEITVHLMQWDDSASTWVAVKSKTRNISNVLGGIDVALFTFKARVDDFAENDRLSIYIENITDGTDAIVQAGSEIYVEVL